MHSNETWQSSQCLEREEAAVGAIVQRLAQSGYQNTHIVSHTRSIWQRGPHKIVVSLVDDAWDCAVDRAKDTPYLFNSDTQVITDNWINTPTVYTVLRLPDSFYGIYSYVPVDLTWTPSRDYTFAVNRIDFKRMRILLNLSQCLGVDGGHVNFNCVLGRHTDPKSNFQNHLIYADKDELSSLKKLAESMPLKNYDIDHDRTYVSSWLNIAVETYSSDNVIALSEKIFRCLVTPVPWIVFAGRYTIARLRSLGFDVLDDYVDHRYDRLSEAQNKISIFVDVARDTIDALKHQDWLALQARCQAAATFNQQLLAKMSLCWPADFEAWLHREIV